MSAMRPRPEHPPALHAHAMDDLRFIRQTMEEAGSFTAVPGWGTVAMGGSALLASWIAARSASPGAWLAVWRAEAVVGLTIAAATMRPKAPGPRVPRFLGPGARV